MVECSSSYSSDKEGRFQDKWNNKCGWWCVCVGQLLQHILQVQYILSVEENFSERERERDIYSTICHPPFAIWLLHPLPVKTDRLIHTVLMSQTTCPGEHLYPLELIQVGVSCRVLKAHRVVHRSEQNQQVVLEVVMVVALDLWVLLALILTFPLSFFPLIYLHHESQTIFDNFPFQTSILHLFLTLSKPLFYYCHLHCSLVSHFNFPFDLLFCTPSHNQVVTRGIHGESCMTSPTLQSQPQEFPE